MRQNIQEIRLFFIAVKQTLHHFHLLQYHPATLSHLKREARKHLKLLFRASILFPEPGPHFCIVPGFVYVRFLSLGKDRYADRLNVLSYA